jgi:AcrR family transcriptional regulator
VNTVKRPYHAPLRAAQAAQTRQRVVAAAGQLFRARGWLGTTVGDIAQTAGVTPQAVHNCVGGKPALLMAAVESAVAGDEPDKALVRRSEFEPAYRTDATVERRAAAFAAGARAVYSRAAPLFVVLAQAAPSDQALADLWERARASRRADCRKLVTTSGPHPRAEAARRADLLFVQSGPTIYCELVGDCGWTEARYEAWLTESVTDLLRQQAG